MTKRKRKTISQKILDSPVPSAIAKLAREVQEIQQPDFQSLSKGPHPWKPEDGYVEEEMLPLPQSILTQADLDENSAEPLLSDSDIYPPDVYPIDYRFKFGTARSKPISVKEARKAMEEAGEMPGAIPYSVWKDRQKRKELFRAAARLTFWQKFQLLFLKRKRDFLNDMLDMLND